jgi:hypothetical protein
VNVLSVFEFHTFKHGFVRHINCECHISNNRDVFGGHYTPEVTGDITAKS